MKIHLSNSVFLGNIDPFFDGFDPSNKDILEITLNKKWIFVHPLALAIVASLALNIDRTKINCDSIKARSGHYLVRMGLFKFLKRKPKILMFKHESAGRFIPVTQIKNSDHLTRFLREMVPLLHLEPIHAEPIRYIISELVRNVFEHAHTENGAFVAAQYFKKSNTIKIGISDMGYGIKKTINASYSAKNDIEAINLALTPGITGTTRKEGGTAENAGAGLFFIKSIARVNRNFFVIYSGKAMYKLLKRPGNEKRIILHSNPSLDKHSIKTDLPYWQGTAVGIDISLDTTREFTALLDLIKETYFKAIKERKKLRYKQPKFI